MSYRKQIWFNKFILLLVGPQKSIMQISELGIWFLTTMKIYESILIELTLAEKRECFEFDLNWIVELIFEKLWGNCLRSTIMTNKLCLFFYFKNLWKRVIHKQANCLFSLCKNQSYMNLKWIWSRGQIVDSGFFISKIKRKDWKNYETERKKNWYFCNCLIDSIV